MQFILICLAVCCLTLTAYSQQAEVGRYDAFSGVSYVASRDLNLAQRGFHSQTGVNVNRWLSIGLDYSVFSGHSSLQPSQLSPRVQNDLIAFAVSQKLPPSVVAGISVPYDATTYTVAGGPQLAYRRWKRVTFLFHPGLGLIHEGVSAKPSGQLQQGVVSYLEGNGMLTPKGRKSDATYFLGVGGGFEINATRHAHLRFTADYVRAALYDGFLRNPRNDIRISVGPSFTFGKALPSR